ncbi:YDG domain-containing protein At5g47160 [Brassica napus]|uniref:YDG domain-containing protein At5g47160 n=1 Tax=Brassica napus TaxID=3708 RepID=UPI0004F1D364|nr:YDG domain-containing protein At5g47160 [Brassica napus]
MLPLYVCRKIIEMRSLSDKKKRVSAVRDFPYGCGTRSVQNQRSVNGREVVQAAHEPSGVAYHHRPACPVNEADSLDEIMKKAGFNVPARSVVDRGRSVSSYSKSCGSKVKPLSSEEASRLIASQSRRRQLSHSHSHSSTMEKQRSSPENGNATALRAKSQRLGINPVTRQNQITKALTPREKVQKVLRIFKLVFKALNKDKPGRHYEARAILMNHEMHVNDKKMIGRVPGIEIGDKFQYKSELNLIGLHFYIRGGIDYITRKGGLKLATSIISSEGNGYTDRFNSDVMIYSGQGGNLTSKDQTVVKDQKLETGNLALANSVEAKNPVRVIRGVKDSRGKCYVYDGLYLVQEYWREKGRGGSVVFRFKLCRVPGQDSTNLRYH